MSKDGTRPLAGQMGNPNDPYGINAQQAGRELDALVAEKVMGWTHLRWTGTGLRGEPREWPHIVHEVPWFSTDIGAAWLIVENLRERGVYLDILDNRHGCYRDTIDGPPLVGFRVEIGTHRAGDEFPTDTRLHAHAATAPLALCRAAITAVSAAPRRADD